MDLLLPKATIPVEKIDGGNALLRIFAIGLVIILHAHTYLVYHDVLQNSHVQYWLDGFCRCCFWVVPAFILLSGYKLLPNKLDWQANFRKRLPKILLPTVFWSIVYCGLRMLLSSYSWQQAWQDFLKSEPFFHLWFMYMLVGLYILAPLYAALVSRFKIRLLYVLIVPVIVLVLMPDSGNEYPWRTPWLISLPYCLLFMIGGVLGCYPLRRLTGILSTVIAVCYLVFMCIGIPLFNLSEAYPFFNYLGGGGVVGGISITLSFLYWGQYLNKRMKLIAFRGSRLVFGAYLFHPLMVTIIVSLPFEVTSLIAYIVLLLVIIVISFMFSLVCINIPYLRNIV